jgi:hypothetical protein
MSLNLALRLTGPHPLWESDTVGSLNADMSVMESEEESRKRKKDFNSLRDLHTLEQHFGTEGTKACLAKGKKNKAGKTKQNEKLCTSPDLLKCISFIPLFKSWSNRFDAVGAVLGVVLVSTKRI